MICRYCGFRVNHECLEAAKAMAKLAAQRTPAGIKSSMAKARAERHPAKNPAICKSCHHPHVQVCSCGCQK